MSKKLGNAIAAPVRLGGRKWKKLGAAQIFEFEEYIAAVRMNRGLRATNAISDAKERAATLAELAGQNVTIADQLAFVQSLSGATKVLSLSLEMDEIDDPVEQDKIILKIADMPPIQTGSPIVLLSMILLGLQPSSVLNGYTVDAVDDGDEDPDPPKPEHSSPAA